MFISSLIYIKQKLGTTKMTTKERMDKQAVVYLYNGISLGNKKE